MGRLGDCAPAEKVEKENILARCKCTSEVERKREQEEGGGGDGVLCITVVLASTRVQHV